MPYNPYEPNPPKRPKLPKRPVAGRDTRPTERETMSGAPRRRRPAPNPRMSMDMPKRIRQTPKYMPSKPKKAQPRRGY